MLPVTPVYELAVRKKLSRRMPFCLNEDGRYLVKGDDVHVHPVRPVPDLPVCPDDRQPCRDGHYQLGIDPLAFAVCEKDDRVCSDDGHDEARAAECPMSGTFPPRMFKKIDVL